MLLVKWMIIQLQQLNGLGEEFSSYGHIYDLLKSKLSEKGIKIEKPILGNAVPDQQNLNSNSVDLKILLLVKGKKNYIARLLSSCT